MKNFKKGLYYSLYLALFIMFLSCETIGTSNRISDTEFELVMVTYRKAWVTGANNVTESANYDKPWNDSIGEIQFKKDSLAFVGLLYINK